MCVCVCVCMCVSVFKYYSAFQTFRQSTYS